MFVTAAVRHNLSHQWAAQPGPGYGTGAPAGCRSRPDHQWPGTVLYGHWGAAAAGRAGPASEAGLRRAGPRRYRTGYRMAARPGPGDPREPRWPGGGSGASLNRPPPPGQPVYRAATELRVQNSECGECFYL